MRRMFQWVIRAVLAGSVSLPPGGQPLVYEFLLLLLRRVPRRLLLLLLLRRVPRRLLLLLLIPLPASSPLACRLVGAASGTRRRGGVPATPITSGLAAGGLVPSRPPSLWPPSRPPSPLTVCRLRPLRVLLCGTSPPTSPRWLGPRSSLSSRWSITSPSSTARPPAPKALGSPRALDFFSSGLGASFDVWTG